MEKLTEQQIKALSAQEFKQYIQDRLDERNRLLDIELKQKQEELRRQSCWAAGKSEYSD
jgi:hypothetical protein